MKERIKEIYSRYEVAFCLIVALFIFSAGCFFGWNVMEKPFTESQFEACEQVARDVYAQQVIVEAPEEFKVTISSTQITIESSNPCYRGTVVVTLRNGELIMKRQVETGEAIFISIMMGILFVCATALLILIPMEITDKLKK